MIGPVERIQPTVSVVVREARTAKQVGSTTFNGGYPEACPMTLFFFGGEPHVVSGSAVPDSTVNGWLSQWR